MSAKIGFIYYTSSIVLFDLTDSGVDGSCLYEEARKHVKWLDERFGDQFHEINAQKVGGTRKMIEMLKLEDFSKPSIITIICHGSITGETMGNERIPWSDVATAISNLGCPNLVVNASSVCVSYLVTELLGKHVNIVVSNNYAASPGAFTHSEMFYERGSRAFSEANTRMYPRNRYYFQDNGIKEGEINWEDRYERLKDIYLNNSSDSKEWKQHEVSLHNYFKKDHPNHSSLIPPEAEE